MALIALDASALIALLQERDTHHAAARARIAEARTEGHAFAISASALAEVLVGASRAGQAEVVDLLAVIRGLGIEITAIDEGVAVTAARIRARLGNRVRLPDAMVLAAAEGAHAHALLTSDRGWPRIDEFAGNVIVL